MNVTMLAVGLLSVFFLFASSIKIAGWQKIIFETQLEMFRNYGLNRQIMAVVGVVELFGAIAIWFQGSPLGTLGALAILGTSTGAIFFHLVDDTWKDGVGTSPSRKSSDTLEASIARTCSNGLYWSLGSSTSD